MINTGFWAKYTREALGRPCFVLAPMADVTDCAFRKTIAKYGKPDVMWTEFVSADGLVRATPEGKAKLMRDLVFDPAVERPIVAQLFSANVEYMTQAAKLCAELGFDGIDINMGCPDRSIEKQKCGAAMIKNPKLAQEIIRAAIAGAADGKEGGLPVSVKTRIGYNKDELDTWLPALLEAKPAVVTVHCRTRKEMSKVPARWEHIKHAVEIRNSLGSKTLIFGNGDVNDIDDAYAKAEATGADGVMLGRAIFGNPWLFKNMEKDAAENVSAHQPSTEEKLRVMVEHTFEFERQLGDIKNFAIMKKHYKAYVNGFDGAKELRLELMENAGSAGDVAEIVDRFLKT